MTILADQLAARLKAAAELAAAAQTRYQAGLKVTVTGIGRPLASAYEQLRNAAEYTDEHLLLLRAVRRFYARSAVLSAKANPELGEELVTELTEAGYFANNTFHQGVIAHINTGIEIYRRLYAELRTHHLADGLAAGWVLDLLAAESERALMTAVSPTQTAEDAFVATAYDYFKTLPPAPALAHLAKTNRRIYDAALHIAVHRALLKSNSLIVRLSLFQAQGTTASRTIPGFIELNRQVDQLFAAPDTDRLTRWVSAQGAPWRILHGLLLERPDLAGLLTNQSGFLAAYRTQIAAEYERLHQRLRRGLVRSLVFLAISKVILGLAVEIPYDLATVGAINWLPLGLNLIFPPLYLALLTTTVRRPGRTNAAAAEQRITAILFEPAADLQPAARRPPRSTGLFNAVFTLSAATLFGGLGWGLAVLGFNVVQGIIFFVFLSTASFLAFRLSRIVRELTVGRERTGLIAALRDAVSLPFIVLGQQLSATYARVNVVAFFLDLMIELPLKSILRLARQWISFLNDKKDEL